MKNIILGGVVVLAVAAAIGFSLSQPRADEVTDFAVIGEITQATSPGSFVILEEKTFETISDCWIWSQEFNGEAYGTGFVSFCWPAPVVAEDSEDDAPVS